MGLRILAPGLSNADAIAHAIVGAAASYGDPPLRAVATKGTGSKGVAGRSVTAALVALAAPGDLKPLARLFDRSAGALRASRNNHLPGFDEAVLAAKQAVAKAQVQANVDWARGLAALEPDPTPAVEPLKPRALMLPNLHVERILPMSVRTEHIAAATVVFARHIPAPTPKPGGLRAQILAALKARPLNSQNLATLLGAKELLVSQTLTMMRKDGQVTSDPAEGATRAHRWSLPAEKAAAE